MYYVLPRFVHVPAVPASLAEGGDRPGLQISQRRRANLFNRRQGVLRFATLDHHRIAIAAATSSTRKMGSNTGGTSHSRRLNVESSRI